MKKSKIIAGFTTLCYFLPNFGGTQISSVSIPAIKQVILPNEPGPVAEFSFNGNINNSISVNSTISSNEKASFVKGLEGKALKISPTKAEEILPLNNQMLLFGPEKDFSVQFWIKTTMAANKPAVILSQKEFHSTSLASQKNAGWVFFLYAGTWGWNMGSGKRRITYERSNGKYQPLNDGRWHQLTMTYDSKASNIRLYYDGIDKVLYNVSDSVGFDFKSTSSLTIGSNHVEMNLQDGILTRIEEGAKSLQNMVNDYNNLGLNKLDPSQFEDLIVDPRGFIRKQINKIKLQKGGDSAQFLESVKSMDLKPVMEAVSALMNNPYTIHQVKDFMIVAPLLKIYSLVDGKVTINQNAAQEYSDSVKLNLPDFEMDNLKVWDRTVTPQEVLSSYAKYFKPQTPKLKQNLTSLTAAEFNIHHGGIHLNQEGNGIDGRVQIARILKNEKADVVMMSESYSSADFIAAELGYYYATTIDWDYLDQGSNISVLSRYPIKEIYVPKGSPFMDVVAKIAISKTRDIYVMANWYGMTHFPEVFRFNQKRFQQSDTIPTFFAGDFNSIPNADGGTRDLASQVLLEHGFTDAYRSMYPDVQKYPGYTHQHHRRIDQLYFKGKGLKLTSIKLISSWPDGWPSDHFLTVAAFDLNYSTHGH